MKTEEFTNIYLFLCIFSAEKDKNIHPFRTPFANVMLSMFAHDRRLTSYKCTHTTMRIISYVPVDVCVCFGVVVAVSGDDDDCVVHISETLKWKVSKFVCGEMVVDTVESTFVVHIHLTSFLPLFFAQAARNRFLWLISWKLKDYRMK